MFIKLFLSFKPEYQLVGCVVSLDEQLERQGRSTVTTWLSILQRNLCSAAGKVERFLDSALLVHKMPASQLDILLRLAPLSERRVMFLFIILDERLLLKEEIIIEWSTYFVPNIALEYNVSGSSTTTPFRGIFLEKAFSVLLDGPNAISIFI